jgi:hypothetical protein
MTEPRTLAEQLDATQSGAEFGNVLMGLFTALEEARDEECFAISPNGRLCERQPPHKGLHRAEPVPGLVERWRGSE